MQWRLSKTNIFKFLSTIFLFVLVLPIVYSAQDLGSSSGAISIPRHKIAVSPTNPQEIWALGWRVYKSEDGGATWLPYVSLPSHIIGDHASMSIDPSSNIYIGDRNDYTSVFFGKLDYPAATLSDVAYSKSLPAPSPGVTAADYQTPNVLAQDENNIWMILRKSGTNSELGNIFYTRSTDGGATFGPSHQIIQATDNVRIGSFLINDTIPAVILLYVTPPADNTNYRYFVWNESQGQFIQNPDSDILSDQILGQQRHFSILYHKGYLHFVWGQDDTLMHAWKLYNNGQGTWNYEVIDTNPYQTNPKDWTPSLTKFGDNIYLFYVISQSDFLTVNADVMNKMYYRVWNGSSWSSSTEISSDFNHYRFVHGPVEMPASADYIPIIWSNSATNHLWFDTISVAPQCNNDNTCDAGEDCSNCPNDCLDAGEVCCGTTAYTGDCCGDGDCLGLDTCVNYVCTAPSPCDDGTCDAGDNCPAYDSLCPDNSCYEPACSNGCQETAVAFGQKDESCTGNNYCDGSGGCTSCRTDLESDCNGAIDNTELMSNINSWYQDSITMTILMESLTYWKRGYI